MRVTVPWSIRTLSCLLHRSTHECGPILLTEKVMIKLNFNERDLAERWGVSVKTLQRWRTEGRGPRYLKLSKRVIYPLDEIQAFESKALYTSTSEKSPSSMAHVLPEAKLLNAQEAAVATGLPIYLFTNKRVRETAGVPCVHINGTMRFDPYAVMNWTRERSAELNGQGIEPPEDTLRHTAGLAVAPDTHSIVGAE